MPDEIQTHEPTLTQAPAKVPQSIAVSDTGLLTPKSHDEVWRICNIWLKSGLCPESFKKPEQVFFAHQTLASLGVNPLTFIRQTAFIRQSFAVFGDIPLVLVNMSKKLACPPLEYLVDEKYERICVDNKNLHHPVFAAVCKMRPAGSDQYQERAYSVQDATIAGKIPAKSPNPWALYLKRMLTLKARGWLIKDLFPEVLNGVSQGEYDHDEMPRNIKSAGNADVVHAHAGEIDLNATYGGDT